MSGLDEYLDRSGFVCANVLYHSLDMTVPSSAYLIHTLDPNYFYPIYRSSLRYTNISRAPSLNVP